MSKTTKVRACTKYRVNVMNAGTLRAVHVLVLATLAICAACTGCAAPVSSGSDGPRDEATIATTQQAITNAADDDGHPAVVALLSEGKVFCTGARHALVGLAKKAPVAPVRVLLEAFDKSFIGLEVQLVGFGTAGPGGEHELRKRVGTTTIESYAGDDFRFQPGPSQTCNGDSGGPAFATIDGHEAVVGLASYKVKTYAAPMENKGCSIIATSASGGHGTARTAGALLLALAGVFAARVRRRA